MIHFKELTPDYSELHFVYVAVPCKFSYDVWLMYCNRSDHVGTITHRAFRDGRCRDQFEVYVAAHAHPGVHIRTIRTIIGRA